MVTAMMCVKSDDKFSEGKYSIGVGDIVIRFLRHGSIAFSFDRVECIINEESMDSAILSFGSFEYDVFNKNAKLEKALLEDEIVSVRPIELEMKFDSEIVEVSPVAFEFVIPRKKSEIIIPLNEELLGVGTAVSNNG